MKKVNVVSNIEQKIYDICLLIGPFKHYIGDKQQG